MKDGERAAADLEQGVWAWAAALMPLISAMVDAILGMVRRMVLALFGGVPTEQVRTPDPVKAAVAANLGEGGRLGQKPRWQDRLVRECLRRIVDGLPLRDRHLDQLPAVVREWLRALDSDDAAAIRHLSADMLRMEFHAYDVGGEVLEGLREQCHRNDGDDDPDLGPVQPHR